MLTAQTLATRNRANDIRAEVGSCEHCGTTHNLTLHHKMPRSMGGNNSRDNLDVLCRDCHDAVHNMRRRRIGLPQIHYDPARSLMAQVIAAATRCHRCHATIEGTPRRQLYVTRIVPLHQGGTTTRENLAVVCASCT